jgi:nucleotide-binding universal stress UspA family protein
MGDIMIRFNKILVPTDFSKGSESAYAAAQKIADTFGGRVDLFHVVPTIKYWAESAKNLGVPIDMGGDIYPKVYEEAEHKLGKIMDDYFKDENKGECKVMIDRKPSETISQYARKMNYDLIVIGAKGQDLTNMVRGSTTEKVIRKSRVPVFSIDGRLDEHDIKNIVMPTDGSDLSFTAFPMSVALADTFNAKLTLFQVMELYGNSVLGNLPQPSRDEVVTVYEEVIKRLKKFLSDQGIESIHIQRSGVSFEDEVTIEDGGQSRSVSMETKVERGVSAHYEIEAYASENADLVVMATHGHSGFAHLILGSTAEKVAQYVKKPVITVRPDKELFEK